MFRLGLLLVCAITLGGCYASHLRADDAGPPVDANLPDPVLALRRAWCESLPRCPLERGGGTNTPLVFVVDVDACIAHGRSWWDEQIAEGRHLDADAARACAAAFGSSCLTDPEMRYVSLPAACLTMFGDEGPALGQACTPSQRCAPGLFCDLAESADCHSALCAAPRPDECSHPCPAPPGALWSSCDGAGGCVPLFEGTTAGVGALCGPGDPSDGRRVAHGCDPGLLCEQPGLDPSTWHCAAPPGHGEACTPGLLSFCAPGTACTGARASDTCEPIAILSALGAACRSDAADPCDSRLDLHCIAGTCQHAMPGALGGTCAPDVALSCGPAHFCGWETSTCIDLAPVPRPLGADCLTAQMCTSGVCLHGVCATSCS